MNKNKNSDCVLGINVSHNASASLMYKGEILLCVQEERLTNKKNFFGYPKKSIDYCINFAKKCLRTGGKLFFEINPNYIKEIENLLLDKCFSNIIVKKDFFGKKRMLSADKI